MKGREKHLARPAPRLRLLSLRKTLIHLHEDLIDIDNCVRRGGHDYIQGPTKLTEFEELVLALEDRRFFKHCGVDIKSMIRELAKAATLQRHGGASTIDMQLVRTATGYYEKSLSRKFYESLLSIIIQFRYSKLSILRSYLNSAYFGTGLRGAESACYNMFNKCIDDCTADEASQVAAMLVYPKPRDPQKSWLIKVSRRAAYGRLIANRLK